MTETPLEPLAAKTRSCLPSLLKSAVATELGRLPDGNACGALKDIVWAVRLPPHDRQTRHVDFLSQFAMVRSPFLERIRPLLMLRFPGAVRALVAVLNAVPVAIDAETHARSRRHAHNAECVSRLDETDELRLGERSHASRVRGVVVGRGLIKAAGQLAIDSALANQIDVAGGRLGLEQCPVAGNGRIAGYVDGCDRASVSDRRRSAGVEREDESGHVELRLRIIGEAAQNRLVEYLNQG